MSLLIEALKQAEARKARLAAEQAAAAKGGASGDAPAVAAGDVAAGQDAHPQRPALELEPLEAGPPAGTDDAPAVAMPVAGPDSPATAAGRGVGDAASVSPAPAPGMRADAPMAGATGPSPDNVAGTGDVTTSRDAAPADARIAAPEAEPSITAAPDAEAGFARDSLHGSAPASQGMGDPLDRDASRAGADARSAAPGVRTPPPGAGATDGAASSSAGPADPSVATTAVHERSASSGASAMTPGAAPPDARAASNGVAAPFATSAPGATPAATATPRAEAPTVPRDARPGTAQAAASAPGRTAATEPVRATPSPQRQAQAVFDAGASRAQPGRPKLVIALGVIGVVLAGGAWLVLDRLADATLAQAPTGDVANSAPPPATPMPADEAATAPGTDIAADGATESPVTGTPIEAPISTAATTPTKAAAPHPARSDASADTGARAQAEPQATASRTPRTRRASASPSATAASPRGTPALDDPRAPHFRRGATPLDPLMRGYEALQAGRLDAARGYYLQALRQSPRHPDALLGLAAIAEREGDVGAAAAAYRDVLRVEPNQPVALSALAELESAADPYAAESGLRSALAGKPDAAPLHFALGNRMAQAGRWSEAQQAYFQAYALDGANADYAFNLAVALDRLHKPALAAEHYRRAMTLARGGAAHGFDPAAAQRRLAQLGGTP